MKSLQIITGRAGQLLPQWKQAVKRSHDQGIRTVSIVPEQYTLQAELQLLQALDAPGLLTDEVISPSRLRLRVFEYAGKPALQPMDDQGRTMAISCAMRDVREQLKSYQKSVDRQSMPAKVSQLLKEFERAGLTPEQLRSHADVYPASSGSGSKLRDLALIWQTYLDDIRGRFSDSGMQQEYVATNVARSGVLTGADVYVYGFDQLQPPFCKTLAAALPVTGSLTVLMLDNHEREADGHIFAAQVQSLAGLRAAVGDAGLTCTSRFSNVSMPERAPALTILERDLFARGLKQAAGGSDDWKSAEGVQIHKAANPHAQVMHAASALRQWHEDGMPWSRMAVALPQGGDLQSILTVTLRAAGIPFHETRKESARRHALCRMLNGSVRGACLGYKQQDMLMAAKSGFTDLTAEEAMRLENYAIEHGIKGSKWKKPFTRGKDADQLEPIRQRLTAPVIRLHDALVQAKTADESLQAVITLLQDCGAYARLVERERQLLDMHMNVQAERNRQVWRIIMGLLDQLHAILSDRPVRLAQLSALLEAGLQSATIGVLPARQDCVLVGTVGNMMPGQVDGLIVMGMQDTATSVSPEGLISEEERISLADYAMRPVGLTHPTRTAQKLLDYYRVISLPKEKLILSCSLSGQDGGVLRESMLLANAKRALPGCLETGGLKESDEDLPLSPQLALQALPRKLRAVKGELEKLPPLWLDVLGWMLHSERWREPVLTVLDGFSAQPRQGLPEALARSLYRDSRISISRLETFAGCPYRYYIQYGLKPTELKEYAFELQDRGNFFHHSMERYAVLAGAEPDWPQLSPRRMDELIDQAMAEDTAQWADGPLGQDLLSMREGDKLRRAVRITARSYTEHARRNGFKLVKAELTFGDGRDDTLPPIRLEVGGQVLLLRGKIDRVDRFDCGDTAFMRVIDYKSSSQALDPARLWLGTQLQLLMYLKAVADGTGQGCPAGAFYFQVKDPKLTLKKLISDPVQLEQEVSKQLSSSMQLSGLVLEDVRVIQAMKAGETGGELGSMFNKDGSISKGKAAVAPQDMELLLRFACMKAEELAERIYSGEIAPRPAGVKNESPCEYCMGKAACEIEKGAGWTPETCEKVSWLDITERVKEMAPEVQDDGTPEDDPEDDL